MACNRPLPRFRKDNQPEMDHFRAEVERRLCDGGGSGVDITGSGFNAPQGSSRQFVHYLINLGGTSSTYNINQDLVLFEANQLVYLEECLVTIWKVFPEWTTVDDASNGDFNIIMNGSHGTPIGGGSGDQTIWTWTWDDGIADNTDTVISRLGTYHPNPISGPFNTWEFLTRETVPEGPKLKLVANINLLQNDSPSDDGNDSNNPAVVGGYVASVRVCYMVSPGVEA